MSVSTDFVTYLNSQSSITTLVGNRICQAPAHIGEALPYIVFMRNGRNSEVSLSGADGEAEPDRTFLDVECRGATQDEAEQVSDALRSLLHGKSFTAGARRVQGCFCTDQSDDYIHLPAGSNEHEEVIETQVEIISE